MTQDEELRQEALRLAVMYHDVGGLVAREIVADAKEFYQFLKGREVPPARKNEAMPRKSGQKAL